MAHTSAYERASVVVIGGGVTGCSVACHLTAAGVSDVLLVEKDELTSGSTCHAAGLVTQFNPPPTMMAFRRYSVELYNRLAVFDGIGSLRIASPPASSTPTSAGFASAAATASWCRCARRATSTRSSDCGGRGRVTCSRRPRPTTSGRTRCRFGPLATPRSARRRCWRSGSPMSPSSASSSARGRSGEYLPLYGGEAVRLGDRVSGRVRSCAYGFTVGRNIAYAYPPAGIEEGAEVHVEVLGEPVAARVAPDVLHDPAHERARA